MALVNAPAVRAQIEVQANPRGSNAPAVLSPKPATAESPVAPSMPDDPQYHAGPYVGALSAPSPSVIRKAYHRCTAKIKDECSNSHQ
jgi:hypothetical protein